MPQLNPIEVYTMTNAGATVTWDVTNPTVRYIINGSATLAASYTFAETGTPVSGMVYIVDYNAQMTLNSNNITIFGRQLTQEEALKKFQLIAVYENSAFQTFILPETSITGRFYNGVTTTTVPSVGGTVTLNPATSKGFQVYNSGAGTVTLSSNYTITAGGTPQEGDEFYVLWSGTIYPDGNTVTIFGETLSDTQVQNGAVLVHVVYNGSAWVVLQGATIPSSSIVSKTYAQLQTMVSGSTLQVNTVYFVSDRNIWVKAIESNKFELSGSFKMLCPDYQNASGLFGGVWISTMSAPTIGNIYSYNNFMWSSVTGAVGTAPSGDAVNWLCLGTYGSGTWKDWVNKTGSYYVEEVYDCEYDFTNDWAQSLHDKKRGNRINGSYSYEQFVSNGFNVIDKFQWGNDNCIANDAEQALINNVNSLGYYRGNVLKEGSSIKANVLTATSYIDANSLSQAASINSNILGASSRISTNSLFQNVELANKTLSASVTLQNNVFRVDVNISQTISVSQLGKVVESGLSTFELTLDLDTAIYAGTTLTIPTYADYVGRFTLTSVADHTITVIVNLPTNHVSHFEGVNGRTYTFTSAAIAGAVAGNPVRTAGAGNDLVVGRTNGADFIEFEKSGTLCRQYNSAILT